MVEAARVLEGDLELAEVALWAVRVRYQMLMGMWDVLHHYQNDCSALLEWQAAQGVLADLGELRDVGLPSDNNNLPFA